MRIRHLRVTTATAIILILLGNVLYAQGSLTNINVNLSSAAAGAEAIYTFTFITSATGNGSTVGILDSGKIEFIFPSGFDVSGVNLVQSKNSNMTGGFSEIIIENIVSDNEDTVRLTRDGTGNNVPGTTEVSIAMGMVINHTLAASNNTVKINTMTNKKIIIDTGTTPVFSIDAGPLHHFMVSTSGSATAGQNFAITITAQDEFNNTVMSFTNQASLNDKTGKISPTITGAFSSGFWSGNVIFKKSYISNQITVTYNNISGNSALFNVLPGSLDHFRFDTISSPQTAGTSFSIKIRAEDSDSNLVTTFNESATLSDNTGTITPTSTGSFSSGQRTLNVTITRSQNDNFITVYHASSGKSGTSNLFNVISGNLAKFYIDPINSPQTAGEWFSITVTAQDQYNNPVTSFNNTINISDLSASITPTVSENFSNGKWSGSVKIGVTFTNDTIKVVRTGGTEQGTSNSFNISTGSLNHFSISTVSSPQTAGLSFSIAIRAEDKEGNTITSFSGPVSIGDLTGTIQPQTSGVFTNGERTETIIITGAKQNNQILVTGNDKNGTSNYFNVNPNSLHYFAFSTISSPQIAGQSFIISIEARDAYDNKVTSFSGSVNLSDKTGTVMPTSSGNFSVGAKSVNVTITMKYNDNQITATDPSSGKNGQSNTFNINPGAIDYIVVRNNPAGLGNEVGDLLLNLNNQIVLYASGYDQWNNYVREVEANWGRTGTLDLPSPLTGTSTTFVPITPGTSGQIYADSSGMIDYTGTITVGNIHHVLIRDAADGSGNVVNTKTITADDTLKLYAAAYDEGNNYLGPAIVDWSNDGNLEPVISYSDMTMITFSPTSAPRSGRITADHETAVDYTTGNIMVNPGAPFGELVLHPHPKSIPAHPDSFAIIASDAIYDSDGNPIAEGELFTVSTTLGKITSPVDQAPGIVGHQVKSNWSSQINFTINADTVGGRAIVHANSVGKGSAVGDTILNISNLEIVSVHSDYGHVSQGQNNVPVRMTVKNRGTEPVKLAYDGASLKFTDSFHSNRSGEYTVTRTDTFSVIPGFSGQKVLTFDIDISSSATPDSITIDGHINGTINGKTVSDTTANQKDKWLVQTPPGLRIERVEASADTVIQGTITSVTVKIRNDGDAAIVIESDSLFFWALTQGKYVTKEYGQFPSTANPDTIQGHSSETFSYSVSIASAATLDTVVLNAKATGHDVNTGISYSDFEADFNDGWRVERATDVQITKFTPSQITVTSGQERDWYLNMVISNSGGANLKLDSVKVKFTIGAIDISDQYFVLAPDFFLASGNDTLLAGRSDTLKIVVDKTGSVTGTITIEGMVYLNDMISGQINQNRFVGISVQSPAQLKIDYARTSQPEVTVSQTFPWQIIMALTNSGGSDVAIDSTQAQDFITFVGDPSFAVTPPTGFSNSGNFILKAGNTDSLFFTIETTGNMPGNRTINAKIFATEINSNRSINVQKNTSIKVESPANIRISRTENLAPNAPYVDSDQLFQIAVVVENLGQDAARDIGISLTTDSLSTILNPVDSIAFVRGGQSDTLKFEVQAHYSWIIDEVFTAKINTARAENTPESDKIFISPAIDSLDTVKVQKPAKMKIVSVIPSLDIVRALTTNEWQIQVAVKDSGAGFILLDQPSLSDVTIFIEGEPQTDYTIILPTTFKNSQDLSLSFWEEDTLIYRVTRTGLKPGLAIIRVNLTGKYLNTGTPFQVVDSTSIYIEPSADVYIDITEPDATLCPNINQYGIAQVNTAQQFGIRSKIRNTGGDRVDNVIVSLTAPGYTIKPDTISYITQSGNTWASFNVTAQQEPIENVDFVAKIKSATSHTGGLPATIGQASDSVASVRVHDPALLRISIHRADSIFTTGTLGAFRVTVENLGTAEVDSSGEIYVEMPDGYHVVVDDQQKSADTTNFKINEQIVWQVLPPSYPSSRDMIIVAISKPPIDKNIDHFASIENTDPFDTLIVKTVPSMLAINSFAITTPSGATDDTLSTLQDFWVQVDVNASENMTSLWASLTLPEDYDFGIGVDSVKNLVNKKATWKLKASANAHSIPKTVKVKVYGTTGTDVQSVKDSIAIVTEKRTLLSIERVEISSPPETDSTLSTGQYFDLSATIVNLGEAGIIGPAYLKIDVGVATGITVVNHDTIKPFLLRKPVTWKLKAPDKVTIKAPITVSLDTIPADENRNQTADTQISTKNFWVETQQSGNAGIDSLWISSPSGALDKVLSTHQTFTIEANVRWQNCSKPPSVTLQLEGGFTTAESYTKTPSGSEQHGRVSWAIRAPEEKKQNQHIWLTLSATDAYSGQQFTVTSDSLEVNVVNRAEIQLSAGIISPQSAEDGIVSTGQDFTVGAFLSNFGEAKLTGTFSAILTLPDGQGYSTDQFLTLTTTHDDTLFWKITAPLAERGIKNIKVQLISRPKDENTGVSIAADAILPPQIYEISIQTEEKSVTISPFSPREQHTIARGDTAISMLGLELICSGKANSNNILFSGVKIKLKDRFNNIIFNPGSVVSRVAAVKYRERSTVYGHVTDISSTNPIEILFSQIDTLKPEIPNKIEFLVDVLGNTDVTDFRIAIDSTDALYLMDEGSGQIPKIKDVNGQNVNVLNFESKPSVIIESDFNKAFMNFPNPFGNPNRPVTRFVYYLDQDTDIEIKIYTLIGDLVWSHSYTANDPQGKKGPHEGDIVWDGRNGQGYRVLNGVYIARINTSYGKSSLTKIAVIK